MNKFLLFLSCVGMLLSNDWNFDQEFLLKKDEVVSGRVMTSGGEKALSLRWTLFKKDGLVLLLKYDHFPHQFILYKDLSRDRYILNLDQSGDKNHLVLQFRGFEDRRAKIWLGVQGNVDFVLN
ncbi:hypothetical protein [Helicobacter mustelae]|uniref:Uncharacterized protein n=2 Tax=Helicobacter mustelae TaxID=217 RepID=D3UJ45_HELM1|nr:hypothetical protein [Helicobacter mustelae]CBG40520.1 Putative hypothetical protein [Helicobacter mustelae 12198]SQH72018.1 Uncharacterised protein [Helicobacter mustelae]STP13161.1 Uncharacterised protein [Helicobacter mustelae]